MTNSVRQVRVRVILYGTRPSTSAIVLYQYDRNGWGQQFRIDIVNNSYNLSFAIFQVSTMTATGEKKAKKPATHPPAAAMVSTAISELKDRNGSSVQAIKKYIAANFDVDIDKQSPFIKRALRDGVAKGKLIQSKGKGASGSFKLNVKAAKAEAAVKAKKEKERAKAQAAREKAKEKAAAKREKAKKAAAEKKAKATDKKKKKTVKKTVEKKKKKPAAKKATSKKIAAKKNTPKKKTKTPVKKAKVAKAKKPAAKKAAKAK